MSIEYTLLMGYGGEYNHKIYPPHVGCNHYRNHMTMFSGHRVFGYFIIIIFVVATPFFTFFEILFVPDALLRCRDVVVAKLRNCRVKSSVNCTYNMCPLIEVGGGGVSHYNIDTPHVCWSESQTIFYLFVCCS